MNELLSSWTLTWFLILNAATLALGIVYYLFEKTKKEES